MNAPASRGFGFWMDMIATIAAVGGFVLLIWLNWSRLFPVQPKIPSDPVPLTGATVRGSADAPIVVIEFSDYMCPFCVKFETGVLPELSKRYVDSGEVQWAFRHLPLEKLHPGAGKASEAALCAARQGKFWEMHAALFIQPKGITEEGLLALGKELGLSEQVYGECVRRGDMAEQVKQDVALAGTLDITGTPGFLIGLRQPDGTVKISGVIDGAQPISVFEEAILAASESDSRGSTWLFAIGVVVAAVAGFLVNRRRLRVQIETGREVRTI